MTQLAAFVAAGGRIDIKGRTFTVEGSPEDQQRKVLTLRSGTAEFRGILCMNAKVAGKPGAEVWSIMASRTHVATFAIHLGELAPVR